MDSPSGDVPKIPDMVMCGDHPSFTKTELNAKEMRCDDKDKPKDAPVTYTRITPTSSRSDHEHRSPQSRRPVLARSLEAVPRIEPGATGCVTNDRALLQAALGSVRWPPYLVCAWVCVLALTHALHCLAAMLDRALPPLKSACQYFRCWTEESWRVQSAVNGRVWPLASACVTGALYAAYGLAYALHTAVTWAIDPLCPDDQPIQDNHSTEETIIAEAILKH